MEIVFILRSQGLSPFETRAFWRALRMKALGVTKDRPPHRASRGASRENI